MKQGRAVHKTAQSAPQNTAPTSPKIALVCDWLTEIGGAEQVIRSLHTLYPDAPIYTSQYHKRVDAYFGGPLDVRTGWLNFFPASLRKFLGPLRQIYFSHLDLSAYDLVISVTGCDAKFIKAKKHICYCHVPTQYYWEKYDSYLKNPGFGPLDPLARLALKTLLPYLRQKDFEAAQLPDIFVTISTYAQKAVKKYYKREAQIIAPPVAIESFQHPVENYKIRKGKCQIKTSPQKNIKQSKSQITKSEQQNYSFSTLVENSPDFVRFLEINRGRYYLNFSRQVNWKNLDFIVRACIRAQKPLLLIGNGPEHTNLQKIAQTTTRAAATHLAKNTSPTPYAYFLPYIPQSNLPEFLSHADAFLFPSVEPFGIAPVEALAAGVPIVALKSGGALDYVVEGKNGVFFSTLSENAIIRALKKFEKLRKRPRSPLKSRPKIQKTALPFSEDRFKTAITELVTATLTSD